MSYVAIFDIEYSAFQKKIWQAIGLAESQALSWQPSRRNDEGLLKIFSTLNIRIDKPYEILSITGGSDKKVTDFGEYISIFLYDALSRFQKRVDNRKKVQAIVLNFFPFTLTRAMADRITNCLRDILNKNSAFKKAYSIILLTRNVNSFKDAYRFQDLVKDRKVKNKIYLFDTEYEDASYNDEKDKDSKINDLDEPKNYTKEISETLEFREPNGLYLSLIYDTNTYIGHFDLGNSHVRTHYDLYSFVCRDDVSYRLKDQIIGLIESGNNTIVGIGLEQSTIDIIGMGLSKDFPKDIRYFFFIGMSYHEYGLKDILESSDCIIILTDIVNTRCTIEELLNHINRFNEKKIPIKIFALTIMKNTKTWVKTGEQIQYAMKINRDFYPANPDECLLCKLKQPLREVSQLKHFADVNEFQLTPYDFWEIVTDSDAIDKDCLDIQGRRFNYRIKTELVVDKYKNWLRNVIKNKFDKHCPEKIPDKVCTVDEPSSIKFAKLVCKSLSIEESEIETFKREDIQILTPSGTINYDYSRFETWKKVLIVDDGINSGDTVQDMIELFNYLGTTIMGILVFDCRLSDHKINRFEQKIDGSFISLYNWRAGEGFAL